MYIRICRRENKDGCVAEYAQLAHNYRDPITGRSKAKILYNFGRREAVDEDALRRLIDSIARFLGPEDELKAQLGGQSAGDFDFVESRPVGGAWLLSGLCHRLGIDTELTRLAKATRAADDIIAERYEKKSILLTSNRAPSEWPELFDDPLLASAALERLADRAHIVSITGKSYRLARTADGKEVSLDQLVTSST
jgi:hypothetical protein